MAYEIVELLWFMVREDISELTLAPGAPPAFIKNRKLVSSPLWDINLTQEECQRLIFSVLFDEEREQLFKRGAIQSNVKIVRTSMPTNLKLPNQTEQFSMNAQQKSGIVSGIVKRRRTGDA